MSRNQVWLSDDLRETWATAISPKLVDCFEKIVSGVPSGTTNTLREHAHNSGIPTKIIRRAVDELEKVGLLNTSVHGQLYEIMYSLPITVTPPADAHWPTWSSEMKKRRSLSSAVRRQVYELDAGVCAYCGTKVDSENFKVDHIYPEQKRGGTSIDNLTVACNACNRSKWFSAPGDPGYLYPQWFRGRRVVGIPTFEQRDGLWFPVMQLEEIAPR